MKDLRRFSFRAFALLAVPALLASACGGDDDAADEPTATSVAGDSTTVSGSDGTGGDDDFQAVIDAANEEGSVVAYLSGGTLEQQAALEAAFEAEYPEIDLQTVRELPQDLQAKVEAEIQTGNGIADVISTGDVLWFDAQTEAGNLEELDFPNLEADGYEPEFVVDGTRFLASANVTGWGWNTNLLPDGIQEQDDFLNPELDGLIGIAEPSQGILVDSYLSYEENRGEDWLEGIAELNPRIYSSTLQIIEALSSGELAASIYVPPLDTAIASGAPVDYLIPENAWMIANWAGQPVSSPNPNAGRVFMNFLVTREAQSAFSSGTVSVLPDTPGTIGYVGDYPIRDIGAITPEEVTAYQARFNELFR